MKLCCCELCTYQMTRLTKQTGHCSACICGCWHVTESHHDQLHLAVAVQSLNRACIPKPTVDCDPAFMTARLACCAMAAFASSGSPPSACMMPAMCCPFPPQPLFGHMFPLYQQAQDALSPVLPRLSQPAPQPAQLSQQAVSQQRGPLPCFLAVLEPHILAGRLRGAPLPPEAVQVHSRPASSNVYRSAVCPGCTGGWLM